MRERFTIGRAAPIDDEGEWEDAFWRLHLWVGIGAFTLGAVLLVLYLRMTPHGPHRGLLTAIALGSVACWLGGFAPLGVRAIAANRRKTFFFVWSVTTLALIATVAALDGGETSPLSILLVLPVLFSGLVYPPLQVGALAVLGIAAFSVVAATGSTLPPRALVTGVMLGLTGIISLTAALNREIKDGARRQLARKLHELATRDGLTGCLSYHAFGDALEAEGNRAQRYGGSFSVVMADIDSFKKINDVNGHDVGDATLRAVARALSQGARSADVTGRIGGDEFAVLLPETDRGQALRVALRLQDAVRGASTPVPVTVSYGTASWSGPTDVATDVLRRADRALYAAKDAGRDRLVVWEPSADQVRPLRPTLPAGDARHVPGSDVLEEFPSAQA
jgi:diguanylate cyclase (GGDEF)-like protein